MRHFKFAHLALAIVMLGGSAGAIAAADPSVDDIYRATSQGHLDRAQSMIGQVLRDHPGSAKAHYVASEVYARAGHLSEARQELAQAQTIDPKLSFANPRAVSELRSELAEGVAPSTFVRRPAGGFPIGWVLILAAAVVGLWLLFRRRAVQPMPVPGPMGAAGPYGPYGYGPQGSVGGGLGHSLATGLAVGAGVVAGEELVRHFVDGEHRGPVGSGFEESGVPPANGDMGGADFGVSDPGGSWDDGGDFGGGDFGGGGDWS